MADPEKYGFRRLEIYKLAHALGVRTHAMSLRLPWFEQREEASQVRRSSKSVSSQIIEGYGVRKYRDEFLHYLHRAAASSDETQGHLDYLFETGSLKDSAEYKALLDGYEKLSASIGRFIIGVERDHSKPFYLRAPENRESRIENHPIKP